MADLKPLNLHLETKLHRKQNKGTKKFGPNSIVMTRIGRHHAEMIDKE